MNAIVVVVDGLGAGHLGPYGNSWLDTPHFNRLAAESVLLDGFYADSIELSAIYRSYMNGQHAFSNGADNATLLQLLQQQDVNSILLSDSREVLELPQSREFSQKIELSVPTIETPVSDLVETQFARIFLDALDAAATAQHPYILWVHCTGLSQVWDAPMANRFQFADEEDPDPADIVTPPNFTLPAKFDPDEALPFVQAHAGQVDVLDTCLGVLLDNFPLLPNHDETLFALTSPRGYPLGEHSQIGLGLSNDSQQTNLYSEHLHVPGLLRYPNSDLAMRRLKRFVQPADLYATLLEWFDVPRPDEIWGRSIPSLLAMDESGLAQELAAAASPNERLLRTRAWLWKQREGESASQLFTKPDDRWEVNEVANRCPKIVDRMELAFDAFRAAAMNNRRSELPQVDEELYDIFR